MGVLHVSDLPWSFCVHLYVGTNGRGLLTITDGKGHALKLILDEQQTEDAKTIEGVEINVFSSSI